MIYWILGIILVVGVVFGISAAIGFAKYALLALIVIGIVFPIIILIIIIYLIRRNL